MFLLQLDSVTPLAKLMDELGPIAVITAAALIIGFSAGMLALKLIGKKADADIEVKKKEEEAKIAKELTEAEADKSKDEFLMNMIVTMFDRLNTKFFGDGNGTQGRLDQLVDKVDSVASSVDEVRQDLEGIHAFIEKTEQETKVWRSGMAKVVAQVVGVSQDNYKRMVNGIGPMIKPCANAAESGMECPVTGIVGRMHDSLVECQKATDKIGANLTELIGED